MWTISISPSLKMSILKWAVFLGQFFNILNDLLSLHGIILNHIMKTWAQLVLQHRALKLIKTSGGIGIAAWC